MPFHSKIETQVSYSRMLDYIRAIPRKDESLLIRCNPLKGCISFGFCLSEPTSLQCIVSVTVAVSFADIWHEACDMWHVTHDIWHVKNDTWYMKDKTWHMKDKTQHMTYDRWKVELTPVFFLYHKNSESQLFPYAGF